MHGIKYLELPQKPLINTKYKIDKMLNKIDLCCSENCLLVKISTKKLKNQININK